MSTNEILLCNFGGPTKEEEVKPFLFRIFNDPLVIKIRSDFFRKMLANRISKKRAPESAHEYAEIGFSPINKMTQIQADQLQALMRKTHPNTDVHVVNRYTPPFASEVVPKLKFDGGRLFIITMYPHFCHSTVATSVREVDIALRDRFNDAEVDSTRVYAGWHNHRYLDYTRRQVHAKVLEVIADRPEGPITVMFSAHGIPKRYRTKGDPYVSESTGHFNEVRRGVIESLKEEGHDTSRIHWILCFQSRATREEWTRPYTDETIDELGKSRGGHLLIFPMSFTSDHIETLYEMDVTYKTQALEAGFESYHRVPGANDDMEFTECLADILRAHGF